MSTILRKKCICAYCGRESEQVTLGSTNVFGYYDLDFRPPEMERSTLPEQIEVCPHCGYAAFELEKKSANLAFLTPGLIESYAYKYCDGIPFETELAKNYYRMGMIFSDLADRKATIRALVRAAWLCDDNDETANAMLCRMQAISNINMLHMERKPDVESWEYYILLKADLLRRTNCFDEVWGTMKHSSNRSPDFQRTAKYQAFLAYKRDNQCHDFGEAKLFCENHPNDIDYTLLESGIKKIQANKAIPPMADYFNGLITDDYRLENYLAEDAIYHSGMNHFQLEGKQAVDEKFKELKLRRLEGVDAVPAVVMGCNDQENSELLKYIGAECLALKYPERKAVTQLAFVEAGEDGLIKKISIVNAESFDFILWPPEDWQGFSPRIVVEERHFDKDGNVKETKTRYLDGSPVDE